MDTYEGNFVCRDQKWSCGGKKLEDKLGTKRIFIPFCLKK